MLIDYGTVEEGASAGPPGTLSRIWTAADLAYGVLAAALGSGMIVLLVALTLLVAGIGEGREKSTVLAVAALALEGVLGLWVMFRRRARGLSWAALGFVPPRRWGPLWVAWAGSYLVLLGYAVVLGILQSFGFDVSRFAQGNTVPIDPADGGFVLLLLAIAVVGLAPLCEELFFRALLFRGLRGFWGLTPSLFASGVLFGAFHLNVGVLLPFTLIGVLFAWSNEQSGSIYTSIAAHGAVNSLSFVLTASGALP